MRSAAAALRAADAATRMGVRRHPVVVAAILSDLAVRATEISGAVDRGRHGNLDHSLIRTLAGDLSRDLGRTRQYARLRHLKPDITIAVDCVLARPLDVASERDLALAVLRYFEGALHLASELSRAVDSTLARHLDRRISLSRDEDLEMACQLADGLDRALARALGLGHDLNVLYLGQGQVSQAGAQVLNIDRAISRALRAAFQRSRALDGVCVQGVAGRLGIAPAEGLAQALLDGALDDFTSADLTHASLADADLTAVRWSLAGTSWPPGTDVKALLARSDKAGPGGSVLVVKRRGMAWPPTR